MRGIIFTGGLAPLPEYCKSIVKKNDLVIAADSGLVLTESAGIRTDMIIGDMDSIDSADRLAKYPPGIIKRFSHDKDFTDTELAFNFLLEKGCNEIWIIGGGGGRIDHLFAIRSMFEREKPPDRWITSQEEIICLDNGKEINLFVKQDDPVSVFPLGDGPWEAESKGLKWQLPCDEWNRGSFGVSNIAPNGKFNLRSIRGRLMAVVPIGDKIGRNN